MILDPKNGPIVYIGIIIEVYKVFVKFEIVLNNIESNPGSNYVFQLFE